MIMGLSIEGLVSCSSSNIRQIVLKLEKDDFYGERSFLGPTTRPYLIVVATFTTVLKLSNYNFDKTLQKYPSIHAEIIAKSIVMLSSNVVAQERIHALTADH